jgi:hypothetical protein
MSTLQVNSLEPRTGSTITIPSGVILNAPGSIVSTATFTDTTNVNTSSTSFIDCYTISYTKKITNSKVFGFFDICSLREASQQQSWAVEINGTIVAELKHKASSTTGWDQRNNALNWAALSGAAPGVYTIKLRLKVVTQGYYNYPTDFGNGHSHYTIMEIAQ